MKPVLQSRRRFYRRGLFRRRGLCRLSRPHHPPWRVTLFVLVVACLASAAVPVQADATVAARTVGASAADPIDFVVLVDESGSLSTQDVARERTAATLLAMGEFSDSSTAAVIGFGSQSAAGGSAVDDVCRPTTTDAAGRQYLNGCIKTLHRRTDAEGNDTDFAAAIREAVSLLQSAPGGRPKIAFLLTDGRFDVGHSPTYDYGDHASPDVRNARGRIDLATQVRRAQRAGTQIWPLGFGDRPSRTELVGLASGGAQGNCPALDAAKPSARIVSDSSAVADALLTAFAGARCAQSTPTDSVHVGSSAQDLTVHVPVLATDVSLAVVKQNPAAVTVSYFDPRGRRVQPDASGSGVTLSGQAGPVEALHISDPLPGDWHLRVTPTGCCGSQTVTAIGIWQGVLQSSILVDPQQPVPGQKATVSMVLQTRASGALTEADLRGIGVSVRVTGSGFSPFTVRLVDDGSGHDAAAHDGTFTASVGVPAKATGELSFSGVMSGQGITADRRTYSARISSGPPLLSGSLVLDTRTVHAGDSVPGHVTLRNTDSAAHRLRLVLAGTAPGGGVTAGLTISPQSVTVAPGQVREVAFTVRTARGTVPGRTLGTVQVLDDRGHPVTSAFLAFEVVKRPGFLRRYAVGLVAALVAVLLATAVTLLRLRDGLRARDLSGVRLVLSDGAGTLSVLNAPVRAGRVLAFGLTGTGGRRRIVSGGDGGAQHRVSRAPDGGLTVRMPDRSRILVARGQRARLAEGLWLAFTDPAGDEQRSARGSGGRPRPRTRGARSGTAQGGAAQRRRPAGERASDGRTEDRRDFDDDVF